MHKKIYFKASRRKDGYIEKPFEKLTDETQDFFSKETRLEAEIINPILESSPHLFEVDNKLSIWKEIYDYLDAFGISHDLSKLYDCQGAKFSLRHYLVYRSCIENNASMYIIARALEVALHKAYYVFHGDINGLASHLDLAYFSGKTVRVVEDQNKTIAGDSRTGEATKAKSELKDIRKKDAIAKANELRGKYPKIAKKAISELICEDMGLSKWTVLDYLKGVKLSS